MANQKRVTQARDQRGVTQRMRPKLAGIFYLFCWNCVVVYFTWRLANPNKNKILPQAGFWCFFRRCSRPKAEPQSKEQTIGVGSLGLLLTFFSLKTLKNGVLRTILFIPNNIKISMVVKLDEVMQDFIMLSGWKKSLGAFVSLENVHNYGGLTPTQIFEIYEYSITSISATNKHRGNFKFWPKNKV